MPYSPRLRAALLLAGAVLIVPTCLTAQPLIKQSKKTKTAKPVKEVSATPKQENQFISVDEFVKTKRGLRTAVSVEGYIVVAIRMGDGSVRLSSVDSVDHVLSATDADNFAKGGAGAIIPSSTLAKHPTWALTAKGLQRVTMYTGAGHAQKALHDVVTKVRLTGFAVGKTINPVTKVEYQDDSGEWKTL